MNHNILKDLSLGCIVLTGSVSIYAQQTISESNLLRNAVELYVRDAVLTDAEALCDGNDMTIGKIESTEGTPSLIVKFAEAVNIGAINLVAGKDVGMTPKQVYVYVRNSDDEEWKVERRIMSTSFPFPFVNFASGVTSKPFSQYKLEMRNIANGGKTITLAELQLLGDEPARNILGGVNNCSLDKNYFDNGVIGENAWRVSLPIALQGCSCFENLLNNCFMKLRYEER